MIFHYDKTTRLISLRTATPYSPDLAPYDLFLFPNMEKSFHGQKFESNEKLIATTEVYFEDSQKTYFSDGFKKLESRWVKCLKLKEDNVEK